MTTGTGQKVPSVRSIFSQTLFQSSLPMKPVSGEKPPMPIMIRSPFSWLVISIFFRPAAFFSSASLSAPSRRQMVRPLPPCGGTSFDMCVSFKMMFSSMSSARRARICVPGDEKTSIMRRPGGWPAAVRRRKSRFARSLAANFVKKWISEKIRPLSRAWPEMRLCGRRWGDFPRPP